MIKLAFKNLMRNKSRTLLTTIGIIIGVIAIILLVSISEGVRKQAINSLGNLNYIEIIQGGALNPALSKLDIKTLNRVEKVREIKDYTIQIHSLAKSFNNKQIGMTKFSGMMPQIINIIGIEPKKYENFKEILSIYNIIQGRIMKEKEDNTILISESLADKENLLLGGLVELNNEKYRIIGIFKQDKVLGAKENVLITIDKLRELTNYSDSEFSEIIITTQPNYDINLIIKKLKNIFENLNIFSNQQSAGQIDSFLSILTTALWIISGISGIIGGIGVTNTMLMSVMERIKEFGVLKAIGWKNIDIIKMIIYEAIIISILGGIIGIIIGLIGGYLIETISEIPIKVTITLIIQVIMFATGIGIIASIYPAYLAGKMSPVEAVRYE